MKLKRIIDISLKSYETVIVPKGEQWSVSLYSMRTGFGTSDVPLNGDEPWLYAGDLPMEAYGPGRIVGFCFSDDNNNGKIKLKKYSDVSMKLKVNESWTVPNGKILVAIARNLSFIPDKVIRCYINGGTNLKANKENNFLTGILFDVIKE